MGCNSMKQKLEEEKILASVSTQIEVERTTTTSLYLASALQEIAKCVGLAISSGQMQLAIPNASARLQRQYYDAIMKHNLHQLLEEDTSESTTCIPNQIHVSQVDGKTSTSAETITNYNGNDYTDEEEVKEANDGSQVPGTFPPCWFKA